MPIPRPLCLPAKSAKPAREATAPLTGPTSPHPLGSDIFGSLMRAAQQERHGVGTALETVLLPLRVSCKKKSRPAPARGEGLASFVTQVKRWEAPPFGVT